MTPEQLELLEKMRIRRRELIAQKNWQGALEVINVSISIQATFDRYHNKGIVLLQLKEINQAIESFEKALELNPDFEKGKVALQKAQKMQVEIETKKYSYRGLASHDDLHESVETVSLGQQETVDFKYNTPMVIAPKEKTHTPSQLPPLPESLPNEKQNINPIYNQKTTYDPEVKKLDSSADKKAKKRNTDFHNFLNPDEM